VSPSINEKRIEVNFTSPDLSSQGGLLLMQEVEQKNSFISHLSDCIEDNYYQSIEMQTSQ